MIPLCPAIEKHLARPLAHHQVPPLSVESPRHVHTQPLPIIQRHLIKNGVPASPPPTTRVLAGLEKICSPHEEHQPKWLSCAHSEEQSDTKMAPKCGDSCYFEQLPCCREHYNQFKSK